MHFRLRYIYVICILIFLASAYYTFHKILKTNVPIHVVTKLIYEPGHDIENAQLCREGDPPKVLIGVISAPKNQEERNVIRATCGNSSRWRGVVVAFVVGRSLDPDENLLIEKESISHYDIIRSNNLDSYTNLTLKTISLLEWAYRHCYNARFVMKCDDDVFVNVTNLVTLANMHSGSKRTIFGELGTCTRPLWWPPRWYVSSLEYDKPYYPNFVFGPAYLISSDSLQPLYKEALNTDFFRLEDVFITGIVAESAKIERVGTLLFVRREYTPEIGKGMKFNVLKEAKMRISIHGVTPSEHLELYGN